MARTVPDKAFREGVGLIESFQGFPDDAAAERRFEERRWRVRPGSRAIAHRAALSRSCGPSHRADRFPYRCGPRRRNFSVKTGTVMHRSKIDLRKWTIATFRWAVSLKGVSSMRRDPSITQRAACFMAQRLREAWSEPPSGMRGLIEVDESFFGGKEKNRRGKRKFRAGGGGVGKTVAAGAKDRPSGGIGAAMVERTDVETPQGFVKARTAEGATIYADEAKADRGMLFEHETVCHGVGEYVNDMAHANGMESFRSPLERGYHGAFRRISPRRPHRYVDEFSTRHNPRPKDMEAMMADTVARTIGKRFTHAAPLADRTEEEIV